MSGVVTAKRATPERIAEARELGSQENWCLAKEKMDDAARLGALSVEDRRFQEQAEIACGLQSGRP